MTNHYRQIDIGFKLETLVIYTRSLDAIFDELSSKNDCYRITI